MTTLREVICSVVRGGTLATIMVASSWVAPAGDTPEKAASNGNESFYQGCGVISVSGAGYYRNCESTRARWVKWIVHRDSGDQLDMDCVGPLEMTYMAADVDEVQLLEDYNDCPFGAALSSARPRKVCRSAKFVDLAPELASGQQRR